MGLNGFTFHVKHNGIPERIKIIKACFLQINVRRKAMEQFQANVLLYYIFANKFPFCFLN
jgi:hypothetical protein